MDAALVWIDTIGKLLISWPMVGLVALAYFREPLLKLIQQFSNSDVTEAKFGPVEIKRQITTLTEKVEEQKAEQEKQKAEIGTLRFLITYFVTDAELTHLEKLARNDLFPYEKTPYFELELRRLRSYGLIRNYPNMGIGTMPQQGNLKEYFTITDRGREYLKLRLDS